MDFPVAEISLPEHLQAPPALMEIVNLKGREGDEIDMGGGIRVRAIRQEGLRVGAQTGLAERYTMIMKYMDKVEPKLNVAFNFAGFVRDGRLLVPAVVENNNNLTVDAETGIVTEVRKAYTIEEEARIVTSVPTWRTYLWQEYAYPEPPHHSLLPRTPVEVDEWKRAVLEGWSAGVTMADQVYQDRMNQLVKAVEGRHLYTTLEAKNMISPAALQVQANKVTFNGRTMNIGEIIYTVGNDAEYRSARNWEPVWTR